MPPQQVTKIVKGEENITLETIDKIENALGTTLITIDSPETIFQDQYRLFGIVPLSKHDVTSAKSIVKMSLKKLSAAVRLKSPFSKTRAYNPPKMPFSLQQPLTRC